MVYDSTDDADFHNTFKISFICFSIHLGDCQNVTINKLHSVIS